MYVNMQTMGNLVLHAPPQMLGRYVLPLPSVSAAHDNAIYTNLLVRLKNGKFGRLRLVSFARSELQLGLDYVRSRAHLTDNCSNSSFSIHTTGLGCTEYGKHICETLNVRSAFYIQFNILYDILVS